MKKLTIIILLFIFSINFSLADSLVLTDIIKEARNTTTVSQKEEKTVQLPQNKQTVQEKQTNTITPETKQQKKTQE